MTPLRGFLLAIPLAVLLAGCPIYTGDGGPDTRPDSGPGPCVGAGCVCETMLDCDPGLVCEGGLCTTPDVPSDCRTHGDCAVGDYCGSARECTGSSTCSLDADCADG
ncbi:MAG: hypothetical protein GWO02_17225, partial [Gammaproteobacteria bacterium]|nr:hypothetical protein [Gammaproteobacteria bacterium]